MEPFNTILTGVLMNLVHSVSFFWQKNIVWVRALRYSLRGCSEWGLILGLYSVTRWLLISIKYYLRIIIIISRQLVTAPPPGLARLSELAMPFYLTHQQLLVPIAAACSWVPYLSKETVTCVRLSISILVIN